MQNTTKDQTGQAEPVSATELEGTLDPSDWPSFRATAHGMLDDMLDYVQHIRKHPVWQPIPEQVRKQFRSGPPRKAAELASVHEEFLKSILPFTSANSHPGFMGWVQGGGTPVGMLAEMLAAGLNANLGGRDQIPLEVERQVVQWTREIFGFPETATGLLVTGTSMANLIAVVVARDAALGFEVRRGGVAADSRRLVAYASTAVHGCIAKAMDICGLGSGSLRFIATDNRHRMDVRALQEAIRRDRDAGLTPFLAVGSAGTVDTGAIDDLAAISDLCRREKLWFHVDGAYGALAKLAPDLAAKLHGIEHADSLAFDFHKWGQVPYDAGFILVRDGARHHQAFASSSAYLLREERGMSAGSPWPCDFGPDLSRSFRALKVWMTLKVYGTDALGAVISRSCGLARYLEERIAAAPELELMAPVELNIVCFRYRLGVEGPVADDLADQLNREIVIELQESGAVAPSTTTIAGRAAIRAAIVNHRTTRADIDALIEAIVTAGHARRHRATPIGVRPAQDKWQPWVEWESQLRQLDAQLETLDALKDRRAGAEVTLHGSMPWIERQVPARELDAQLGAMKERQKDLEVSMRVKRAMLLALLGRRAEARADHLKVLTLDPANRLNLIGFGQLLMETGYCQAAQTVYAEAVKHHPDDIASRVNLGSTLLQRGDAQAAREQYEAALRIDPEYPQAHAGIYYALARLGETEIAELHRQKSFGQKSLFPSVYRGDSQPVSVVLLVSSKGGNAPIQKLLDDRVFQTYVVVADFHDANGALPAHDLVVNGVGDADVAADALDAAESLAALSSAPIVNAPAAVRATSRCDIARRLGAVPGVVTPRTAVVSRELLARPDAQSLLKEQGFEFPVLLRTPGFHGGEHFVRVESCDQMHAALGQLPGGNLIAIQFLDARAADGKTRKYRVMTIDGRLYPLHAAISSRWKVHYFSAEMADYPEHRAEEARFLGNMGDVLGPRAVAALEEIQKTLGLEYGGIDFGLSAKGEVLLFEANATMVAAEPDADARWDYRRAAVERIYAAVREMLMKTAKKPERGLSGNSQVDATVSLVAP